MSDALNLFRRRRKRVRLSLRKAANGRPRLSMFRSNQHVYAQVIDDVLGQTLVAASTVEADIAKALGKVRKGGIEAAQIVGKYVAERALKANVKEVIFDRGGYIYHGKVKALAEAARAAGLKF